LSKIDNIFNPKSRETKLKLAQDRSKKFQRSLLTYSNRNMNANIEIVFSRFSQNWLFELTWFMFGR